MAIISIVRGPRTEYYTSNVRDSSLYPYPGLATPAPLRVKRVKKEERIMAEAAVRQVQLLGYEWDEDLQSWTMPGTIDPEDIRVQAI